MNTNYDLIVIGTGPAASSVARDVAGEGKSVAVVEAREVGGTCALRGCNPKKVYVNAAALVDQARRANGKLARFDGVRIDWPELLAFKKIFTDSVPEKVTESFEKLGIDIIHGSAEFAGPDEVRVGERRLKAKRILIGVGARPTPLGISGSEHVTDSDSFLEREHMPERVVFLGGGYISMEFAHVVARFGSKATVIQRRPRPLKTFDPDLVDQLVDWSEENGIAILADAEVTGIAKTDSGAFAVTYEQAGQDKTLEADLVVHGAGRVPNLDGMSLEAGNIDHDDKGVYVDKFLRSTSNPAVFAAGDCVAMEEPRLTPTANEQARSVTKNLFADEPDFEPDYGPIAQVAFTVPCIASVGMLEGEAKDAGHDVEVRHEDISSWNSVRKSTVECAGYKLVIDKKTDKILGAHLLGPGAEESINLFALAMKFGLTSKDVKSTLFAFPTYAADVRQMV